MEILNKKRTELLIKLYLNDKKGVVKNFTRLSREFFTEASGRKVLKLFIEKGFVTTTKKGRELTINITPLGKKIAKHLNTLYNYLYD